MASPSSAVPAADLGATPPPAAARRARPGLRRPTARRAAPLLLAALASAGCGDDLPTGPPPALRELPRALTASERAVVAGSNAFAWELLRRAHAASPGRSTFLSPLSASAALGMTALGADGRTYDAMREVLGFQGLAHDELAAAYGSLLDLLPGLDPSVDLAVANALWHREGEVLLAPFLDAVRTHFDARVEGLDFGDPAATDVINAWVSDATGGAIETLVKPPIPSNLVLYLMNAVHFRGGWRAPFDPNDTRPADFHLPDGSTATVSMMALDADSLAYASGDGWDAVELPYGAGAWVMDLVVPRPGVALAEAVASIEAAVADLDAAPRGRVAVHLPRFELEWEGVLDSALIALGMAEAFTPAADFSRMRAGGGLWIDEVKQKTFVAVDERGTVAAAATSVALIDSAPPTVRADRPFLVVIRERLSGAVLFAGAVVEAPREG